MSRKADPADPNTWSEGAQNVLRFVARDGGWYVGWKGAPTAASRCAVERLTGVHFDSTNLHHEPRWYEPQGTGAAVLLALHALLPPEKQAQEGIR